jgi:phenylalanyl-tRNA synthetase beta chain
MKVTYNWLKEFVDIKIAPALLAHKLTMAGLEVTSWEEKGGDFVFELEITSNRPDLLSVIGIAREVAAITGATMVHGPWSIVYSKPKSRRLAKERAHFLLKIEDKRNCSLYTAKIIQGVKIGPSPDWLKKRLELVGCRCVNNIVDITNYVLFELGEPLHAFDLDTLAGNMIIVRRAGKEEKLVSIDAEVRSLNPEILVIADKEKPVAIAGVMGAKVTEVSGNTKNILLEAAIFNPLIVRRGRQKLGIQSEASYRFERGIDPQIVQIASQRTVELIQEIAGGSFVLAKSAGLAKSAKKKIDLDIDRANKNLGINIAASEIKRILSGLGFRVNSKAKERFSIDIPSYRQDVKAQIDLVEEIARIFGYENIPTTLPQVTLQTQAEEMASLIPLIKNILYGLGLNEVITYSLIDRELLRGFWDKENNLIEIANPLSKEQEVLRPLLLPSLARCVAYNLRQKQGYINIFEIAKTYVKPNQEQYILAIALCGMKSRWFGPGQGHLQDEVGFLHLKGILTELFGCLGISVKECEFKGSDYEFDVYVRGTKIGMLRRLREDILDNLDIKHKEVFEAEITLDKLLSHTQLNKKFAPFPRYPGITRDVTLELKEEIPLEKIMKAATQLGGKLLWEVNFTAFYKGEKVAAGFKRVTISCLYLSAERTLTEGEINFEHSSIVKGLQEQFNAKIC